MKLFIVESPNKCAKLRKFLGKDYYVAASVGHIRSIPHKGMNIDIANGFVPVFEVSKEKKKVVKDIKTLADKADEIIIATDPDREGEAIAWHIYDVLTAKNQKKCTRVTFNQITKSAVLNSLKEKRDIDMNCVNAQKARQVLDRLIGYSLSPLLWYKVESKTSAGRVQSVALKLVATKEKEIKAFKSTDFWKIDALLKCRDGEFTARVVTKDKDNRYLDEKVSQDDFEKLKNATYKIDNIENKERSIKPYPPFDTSSLQTTASSLFSWPVKKTSTISQKLYEKGYCFLPGTLIQLRSGEILPIEEAVKKGETWLHSTDLREHKDIEVEAKPLSFNFKGNVHKIKTSTSCVDVTSDHIFPVYDTVLGEIVDKKASDIEVGRDYLLYSKDVKSSESVVKTSVLDIFKSSPDRKKILIHFKEGFLRSKIKAKDLCQFDIAESTKYKYIRNDMLPFDIAVSIFSEGEIKRQYKSLKWSSGNSYELNIPFYINNTLISYLSGLIISDGHLTQGGVSLGALLLKNPTKINIDEIVDVRQEVNNLMKLIGVRSSQNLSYKNRLLSLLFNEIGIPYGKKSGLVKTPKVVMKWSNECKKAFISGLFDGDGYFAFNKIKGRKVSIQSGYTSKSDMLIRELQILFSNFGLASRIYEDKRNAIKTVKVSVLDTPYLNSLIKKYSLIKSEIYDVLKKDLDKKRINAKSKDPYSVPLNKIFIEEIERSPFTKSEISNDLGIDIWSFTSKKNHIPIDKCIKIAKKIGSDTLLDLTSYRFDKVLSNEVENYEGDVFCFETSNDYFQVANGLITHNCTYIRTDSFAIAKEAVTEVRELIKDNVGDCYLPAKANFFKKKAKSSAQEAHECIRPTTSVDRGDGLSGDELKLYKLIRERFVACQMTPMIIDTVVYNVKASTKHDLVSKGQTIRFDGWSKVYKYGGAKVELLPVATSQEDLDLQDITNTKGTTNPPPRYSEGSLVKKMEDAGVGRPSTYPSIMENIQKRNYVRKMDKKGTLEATDLGIRVYEYLESHFKDFIMDVKYTAALESDLDIIEDGTKTYEEVVQNVYEIMMESVTKAKGDPKEKPKGISKCLECKNGMVVEKHGKFGKFYTCDQYPKCKTIYTLGEDGKFSKKVYNKPKSTGKDCPECKKNKRDGVLLERTNRKDNTTFYGCSKYPKCKHTETNIDAIGEKKDS